jgi:MFS family permease
MLSRFLNPKTHEKIHQLVLVLFTVGIVCSKALMSIGIFLGLLNLILEGKFNEYWKSLKTSISFWLISGLFFLHVIGLLWTSNLAEGVDDLRMKTTLVTVPLILFSKPDLAICKKQFLLKLLITTVSLISLINVLAYFQLFGYREYLDMRDLSLFGSHIRFSLLVAFSIGVSLFYYVESRKMYFLPAIIFLVFYTIFSQVFSGLVALLIVLMSLGLFYLKNKRLKLLGYATIFIVFFSVSAIVVYILQPPAIKELAVNINQLSEEWNKKSKLNFNGRDKKEQPLYSTIIRYLHSKDLSADSVGFSKLSEKDIGEIENGTADIHEKTPGFIGKLNEVRFQLHQTNDPNGSTIRQRFEFWKTGLEIIQENWLLGVGTGDIKLEFQKKFQENNSKLLPQNRLEAHNTFLTFFITFGIIGLLYFLYFLYSGVFILYASNNIIGLLFLLIMISSFMTEDTLETQMGITIFAFLFSLLSLKEVNSLS